MSTIGFIGASGLMGHGMARNLLAKGHAVRLTVHRNRERVADLLAAGATEAATPAALAAGCEWVFVCVTGSPQVEAVLAGPGGLLEAAAPGLVVVDCCCVGVRYFFVRMLESDVQDANAISPIHSSSPIIKLDTPQLLAIFECRFTNLFDGGE